MVSLSNTKKNKIVLGDYNYLRDIDNRLLMAQFSILDFAVLEEILFSPLKIQIRKISKNIEESEENVQRVLEKLSHTGLFTFEDDSILVDKEMRKYFESEIQKFDAHFKPDMDFLQNLLKKVPIHVLPLWYAIPRTSNNIFDSLLEKYLETPLVFQRYLMELEMGNPMLSAIVNDVYRSPNFCLTGKAVCDKYGISHEQFEESMFHLEFNFVCALGYRKNGDQWEEIVTPFQEWKEYLTFLRDTTAKAIPDFSKIKRVRPNDYSFVQDMATLINLAQKQPIVLNAKGYATLGATLEELGDNIAYLKQLIHKLRLLKLVDVIDNKLQVLENVHEWLDMRFENRALFLYRHPLNRIYSTDFPPDLMNERSLREAEKSIQRVLYNGWILFDDFVKGAFVPLTEQGAVVLKKIGKNWRYTIPEYNTDEKAFLKAVVFEWLLEIGITATGTYEGQDCFCVTSLGQSLF